MSAGFCAATGDAVSSVQVLSWRFRSLEQEGAVLAFGANALGQLGLNDRSSRARPNLLTALDGVVVVDAAAGQEHSIAIGADGKVFAWGGNSLGQLGLGDTIERLVPTVVRRLWDLQRQFEREGQFFKPVKVAAGHFHSLVVVDRGSHHEVYGFGDNSFAQLGCVEVCCINVFGIADFEMLTAERGLGDQICNDDQICKTLCPSFSKDALLIRYPSKLSSLAPNILPDYPSIILKIASIHAGAFHSVVLTAACDGCARATVCHSPPVCNCSLDLIGECAAQVGDVITFGSNIRGQLGDGRGLSPWATSERPVNLRHAAESPLAAANISEVAAGAFHNLALTDQGRVLVWGGNYFGQLGICHC